MGDSDYIQKQFSANSNNTSSLQVNFGGKSKEVQWKEYFSFNFLVQVDTQMRPYIYFNDDMTKMLVQGSTDFNALIYTRSDVSPQNEVKWRILYQIHRYPIILKGLSSANFLFSPSFEKFIDVDFINSEFVIK